MNQRIETAFEIDAIGWPENDGLPLEFKLEHGEATEIADVSEFINNCDDALVLEGPSYES